MIKLLKKIWEWFDDRTGTSDLLMPMMKHLVPPGAKWYYVFGSATLFLFILQVVTGVALSLMYQPTSSTAYDSLKFITESAPLGNILRGIHFYGASAMILFVGIHMIRVYLFAAFKYPREMSWVSGIFLLALTLGMGFTGQLLRWDSNGVWSAVVGAEQAGRVPFIGKDIAHFLLAGETLGGATLSRFFAIHVFLIPAMMFGLLAMHLYLVIRHGISEPPRAGEPVDPKTYKKWYEGMLREKGVPFWPNAAWRDMTFGLLVVLAVLALAFFIGPPEVGAPPDPANINANPRPDWYFLWIFALFAVMPRSIESFAIAVIPVVAGVILIAMPFIFNKGERSPIRRPWSIAIVIFIVMMIGVFWRLGVEAPWSPDLEAKPLPVSVVGNVDPVSKEGALLFHNKACIYCHTISGFGGKRGPDLTLVGSRLTEDQIVIKIVNGGGNMPAYGGTLSHDELTRLVSFLKTRK
jgi:ubiquinol-cytochrome c reductase cytochrome b subunit